MSREVSLIDLKWDHHSHSGGILRDNQTVFDLRTVTAGTYFVRVYGYQNAKAPYTLSISN